MMSRLKELRGKSEGGRVEKNEAIICLLVTMKNYLYLREQVSVTGYLTFRNGHDFCSYDKLSLTGVSLIEHRHLHQFRAGPFDAPVPFPEWIGRTAAW